MDEISSRIIHILEHSPLLVGLYDPDDRLRYANQAFRETFFIGADETPTWQEIMRRNFHSGRGTVISATDFEEWLMSTQARRGKIGFRCYETDLMDGHWLWMKETTLEDGWMLCVASDVTALHADARDLRQDRDSAVKAAHTDELTGVVNRRYAMARIKEMLRGQAGDDPTPGCLAVLDIDTFKDINDRYGHVAGDDVLRAFAKTIGGSVRRSDCFARVGGEEFVLVMPRTTHDQATGILERMLDAVRASRPLAVDADFAYTFSAGLAESEPGDVPLSLYARADSALMAAKSAGRDRICSAQAS